MDPSLNIQKRLDKGKSAVLFFGRHFLPVNYYKSLLSTKKDNYAIYADSTFDSKKRLLAMATDVSTRYTRRSRSEYERIAGYINAVVTQKTGNYMVFFPSYKMMNDVADIYCEKLCRRNRAYAAEKLICQRLRGRNFWTGLVRNRTEHLWHLASWEAYSVRALI